MSEPKYALTGIGNAMVDALSKVDDSFISQMGMEKGIMQLIEETRAVEIYAAMKPEAETGGGSAANTMAGFASFGGKGAFIGKVADDAVGKTFAKDLRDLGLDYETQPLAIGPATGRCMVLITPDAQRTMNTYLGAGVELCPNDIDIDIISSSAVTYLEGYLFDPPHAKNAFIKAGEIAHAAGHKVSLTLSDPFCVERHREDFKDLVQNHVDILFANEDEIKSLYQVNSFEDAAQIVAGKCEIACLTRSEKGSVIVSKDQQYIIEAAPTKLVDTTGAGDQYAAGFLYGYTQGMPLDECGKLGALAAAEVISHMGPRPLINYSEFLNEAVKQNVNTGT